MVGKKEARAVLIVCSTADEAETTELLVCLNSYLYELLATSKKIHTRSGRRKALDSVKSPSE